MNIKLFMEWYQHEQAFVALVYHGWGYFGSALQMCPHLFCYQSSIRFLVCNRGLKQKMICPTLSPTDWNTAWTSWQLAAGLTHWEELPYTLIYTKGQLRVTNLANPQMNDCLLYNPKTQGEPADPGPSCCEVRVLTTHRYVHIYDQNISPVNWCGKIVF